LLDLGLVGLVVVGVGVVVELWLFGDGLGSEARCCQAYVLFCD